MSRFFIYLRLQLRRCARYLPFVLAVSFLLAAAAGLIGVLLADDRQTADDMQKVEIGVVGETDSGYLRTGLYIMETVDTSGYAITFSLMDLEEAEEGLRSGRLVAYLIVPEGFAAKLGTREQLAVTCVTASDSADVGTRLIDDLAGSVGDLLLGAQNAIIGLDVYMDVYAPEADQAAVIDRLQDSYTNSLLNRSSLLKVQTIGFGESLSFAGYFLCALLSFFLALWGMSAAPLFSRRSRELSGLLTLRGLGPFGQTLSEFLSYALLLTLSTALVLAAALALLGSFGISIPELQGLSVGLLISRALWTLPVGLMLASLSFFLYELVQGGVGSVLLQFLTALGLGYLSGCLYPISFFPDALRDVGEYLPTGLARRAFSAVLNRGSPGTILWMVLLYLALFFAGSALLRRGRIRGGAQ